MDEVEFVKKNMIFVMDYQMLISRDSENIHFTWKYSVIIGLCSITLISFGLHFGTKAISSGFELGLFGQNASFHNRRPEDVDKIKEIVFLQDPEGARKIGCSSDGRFYINNEQDYHFLTTKFTNIVYLNFDALRIFLEILPILSGSISVILIVMMCIYHTGSQTRSWGVPQPWRIVLPSIIFFLIMAISSLTFTILTQKHINALCETIFKELTNAKNLTCSDVLQVMGKYVRRKHMFCNYLQWYTSATIMLPILWAIIFAIMLVRVFLGIDFTLVNVVLSAYKPVQTIVKEDMDDKEGQGASIELTN